MSNRREQVRALHIRPSEVSSIAMWGMGYIDAKRDKNGHRHYGLSWNFDYETLTYKSSNGEADVELPLEGVAAYLKESRNQDELIKAMTVDLGKCYGLAKAMVMSDIGKEFGE